MLIGKVGRVKFNIFNLNVPTEIIDIAKNHESPYDFLDGYFISTNKNYETLDSKR